MCDLGHTVNAVRKRQWKHRELGIMVDCVEAPYLQVLREVSFLLSLLRTIPKAWPLSPTRETVSTCIKVAVSACKRCSPARDGHQQETVTSKRRSLGSRPLVAFMPSEETDGEEGHWGPSSEILAAPSCSSQPLVCNSSPTAYDLRVKCAGRRGSAWECSSLHAGEGSWKRDLSSWLWGRRHPYWEKSFLLCLLSSPVNSPSPMLCTQA